MFSNTRVLLFVLLLGFFLLVRQPSTSTDTDTKTKTEPLSDDEAIEAIDVSQLLRLPGNCGNATYPRVYNRGETLHIITTTFMQYQPKLIDLGKANLKLFEAFCLPAMIHQTSQNFF
jgi:hypothetical protein